MNDISLLLGLVFTSGEVADHFLITVASTYNRIVASITRFIVS